MFWDDFKSFYYLHQCYNIVEERGILPLCNTFSFQFRSGQTGSNSKPVTLSSLRGHSWLTCVINIRSGQAIFLRKKAYHSTLIISERVHSGNIWVSACQESGLNSLSHYTNCVLYSFVFIVCTNYGDISKIRCPQLCQLCNSTSWFFIWIWFQLKNMSRGCYPSTFQDIASDRLQTCGWATLCLHLLSYESSPPSHKLLNNYFAYHQQCAL